MSTAFQYREQDQVFACREESHTSRVWYLGGSSIGCRKLFCTSIFLFPAALVFLSVGIRVVQLYLGAALAITWVVMPNTFIGLWRSAMTLVFLSCVRGEKKKNASSDLCLVLFFMNLTRQRLNCHGFVLVVKICLNVSCPLHFYIQRHEYIYQCVEWTQCWFYWKCNCFFLYLH